MIDLDIHTPKRVEIKRYKNATADTKIYVFDCFSCGLYEIRSEKKYLKKHSGKCRHCVQQGVPHLSNYNHFKDCVIRTSKKRSKKKDFNLSFEEFLEFTKINKCEYCNSSIYWAKHTGDGRFRYNLDRKDSDLGYIKDNLVVCCKRCNNMKGAHYSYIEFKAIVGLLHFTRNGRFKHE